MMPLTKARYLGPYLESKFTTKMSKVYYQYLGIYLNSS